MNPLSARLSKIASFIPKGAFLADVGSDHGYLPIELAKRGQIVYALAIDNKKGPYESCLKHIKEEGVANIVEASLSSGLDQVSKKIDTLSLCGMGGLLILDILEKGKEKLSRIQTLVVDCHRDTPLLRKGIVKLGYALVLEEMLFDKGIYYTIMRWERAKSIPNYNNDDFLFGPIARKQKSSIYQDYLAKWLKEDENILSNANLPETRKKELLEEVERIKKNQ